MYHTKQYLSWGAQGKPIVLLHYFGGAAASWQWVAEILESNHRCIAFNLPGFGKTEPLNHLSIGTFAEWIGKQLKQLGISSCTLVGHSMSGKLALEVAARYPDLLIEQVILVAPSPPSQEPMPEKEKQRMLQHPNREEAIKTVEKATIKPLSSEQKALAVQTQLDIDHATWRWWLLEGMDHSITSHLSQIKAPVSVLASKDDPAIPYDAIVDDLEKFLPQAHLNSTEKVGHLLPLEDPGWVAREIHEISKLSVLPRTNS